MSPFWWMVYRIGSWWILKYMFKILFRLQVKGIENLPPKGGVLLASNHSSYLDPPLIMSFSPRRVIFMAKKELFSIPVLGTVISQSAIPIIRNKPDRQALKKALELLEKGEVLCIFPEGTRTKDGSLGSAHLGIGFIVAHTTAPVLPVAISGTFNILHQKRVPRIKVNIGKPIAFENKSQKDKKLLYQEIASQVMNAIRELLKEID